MSTLMVHHLKDHYDQEEYSQVSILLMRTGSSKLIYKLCQCNHLSIDAKRVGLEAHPATATYSRVHRAARPGD
jgi:hypothetical protein